MQIDNNQNMIFRRCIDRWKNIHGIKGGNNQKRKLGALRIKLHPQCVADTYFFNMKPLDFHSILTPFFIIDTT